MSNPARPIASIGDLALEAFEEGSLYRGSDASFASLLGLSGLGIRYNEVPAGMSSCPFHNHHVEEEMFIILEGEGTYRFGPASYAFKAGDVLGAPAGGRETAHQIINTGSNALRYLGVSTVAATEVCEYPDSGKFLVSSRAGTERLRHIGRAGEHNLDYWDGEPGA
ncbi:cupin domain-containing protein [Youhaiella tibetensis]|uniref:Cupin domain-containing protein n=1 Tax=Paradevosia tibetensis TaxID=1447062 RepID=A0A5B9DQW0_9HYPH|nr:cupin domain-containing protein [Youhaiella tibetensis]QEE20828.1 cupin domain-containing protein [Youhaiella tibetensis]